MQATNELAHLLQDVLRAEARMRLTRLQLLLFVERKPEEVIGYLNKLPPQFEQHCSLLKQLRGAAAAKCCGEYLKAMFPMGEGKEQS